MQINEQPYISHFRSMAESTVEDVKHFVKEFNNYLKPSYLTEMYIKFLVELKHCKEGFPIDRYQHSLQTATRAYRDKRDNEYVVMCLLHDVAEVFDPYHHDGIIAELLKNYISDKNYFILKYHTTFQGFYYWDKLGLDKNARDKYKTNPYYEDALEFVDKYDDKAFDPDYKNMSLEEFRPMLLEFFENRKSNKGSFV